MLRQVRLLLGISFFWLALSMLSDGINTLVLPVQLSRLANQHTQATLLGLLTFIGLLAGALIQPLGGALSDRLRNRLGRRGFIGIGLILTLASLFLFAVFDNLIGLTLSYLAIQLSASLAQSGQQGLIPDLVSEQRRGLASGMKGFMDLAGAMAGFVLLGQLLGSGRTMLAVGAIGIGLVITYLIAALLTPEDKPNPNLTTQSRTISLRNVFLLDLRHQKAFVHLLLSRFLFLLGIYLTGRFLLFFVADRLGLQAEQAAEQAGNLLAALALITVLASPLTGWLADRFGRLPLLISGAVFGAVSALLLVWARNAGQILIFGGLMSLASAAFMGGSWALLADIVPQNESARFFGLANFGTAGAAAVAGLFGPLIDWIERISPGNGYSTLFIVAAIAFLASALPLRHGLLKEVNYVERKDREKEKDHADAPGLAVVSLPANPAGAEENPHSS